MLHEVLLALSGHPSPLFDQRETDNPEFPLSPSEHALLQTLARLSDLHRKLRDHAAWLAAHHRSVICCAVATSIRQVHLDRFQRKILDVESRILTKDSSIVGAYEIVPLAGIAIEFDQWHRRMEWFWRIACFIAPPGEKAHAHHATGAALIDRLRLEALTGFSDIEQAATELGKVAETTWLRQLSSWVVYGKLPQVGATDFFIKPNYASKDEPSSFRKDSQLLPSFVPSSTASSILFIGKSINQLTQRGKQGLDRKTPLPQVLSDSRISKAHLQHLSSLVLPINPTNFSGAISAIRLSLSKNVLQDLLSVDTVMTLLSCLRQYFLLSRGDFSITLIDEAENRLQARWQSMGRLLQQDPVKALRGLSIKDAELGQSLNETWKRLAFVNEDMEDEVLEFAQKHMVLGAPRQATSRPSSSSDSLTESTMKISTIAFNDLLFPSATALTMTIPSPLDLFLSPKDVEIYSTINSYLLAMRRSHLRLSELWRKTAIRRTRPSRTAISGMSDSEKQRLFESRRRMQARAVGARKVWATCSAAFSLLAEAVAYFEGEIIKGSWNHFEEWVREDIDGEEPVTLHEQGTPPGQDLRKKAQRDPETLASAHIAFLAALTYALLLNEQIYTKELRSLLGNIDHLIAFFNRLVEVQQKRDLELEQGFGLGSSLNVDEENKVVIELDRARKRVDSDLESVIHQLRTIDQERLGSARFWDRGIFELETGGFEPWKAAGGVDRLLMKLEFGSVVSETPDLI